MTASQPDSVRARVWTKWCMSIRATRSRVRALGSSGTRPTAAKLRYGYGGPRGSLNRTVASASQDVVLTLPFSASRPSAIVVLATPRVPRLYNLRFFRSRRGRKHY